MRRIFVGQRGRYRVVVEETAVQIAAWRSVHPLTLTGQVASDLGDDLRKGELRAQTRARIAAASSLMGSRNKPLLNALLHESFVPATASSLVRRDGFDTLWIELLAQCNERCIHCYSSAGPQRSERLDPQLVMHVLEQAEALGFRRVQFTGGEPLLYDALVDVVVRARTLGLQVEIFTNGQRLDGALLSKLAIHDVSFALSLYGDRAEVHDAITQLAGSWRNTVDAIARISHTHLGLRVAVVIMEANRHVASDTLQFAHSVRIDARRGGAASRTRMFRSRRPDGRSSQQRARLNR